LGDFEIRLLQIADWIAVLVADDHVDAHEVHAGSKDRRALCRWLLGGGRRLLRAGVLLAGRGRWLLLRGIAANADYHDGHDDRPEHEAHSACHILYLRPINGGGNIRLVATQLSEHARPALTLLSEDERLFRDSVYEFADREVRPLVRQMDEQEKIPRSLI